MSEEPGRIGEALSKPGESFGKQQETVRDNLIVPRVEYRYLVRVAIWADQVLWCNTPGNRLRLREELTNLSTVDGWQLYAESAPPAEVRGEVEEAK